MVRDDTLQQLRPYVSPLVPSAPRLPRRSPRRLANLPASVNGSKYFSDNYIFVANEDTIERQKSFANKEQLGPRTKSNDDWVARILEIRASDEHHVYARVYWMYWPDELPAGTVDGKKTVEGRQPYHGQNELIASNHSKCQNPCERSPNLELTLLQWISSTLSRSPSKPQSTK